MVVSESTSWSWVWDAEQAGDRGERQLLRQQTGPFLQAAGQDDTVMCGQDGVAGHHVSLRFRMGTDLAREAESAETANDSDGLVAVTMHRLRGKTLPVLLRQLSIDDVPLGLEQAAEDGISRLLGGRFQFIERCLRLQGGDIGRGQVEGREFGHVVTVRIVNAADKHANMAHGVLLDQNNGYMLPQPEPVPDRNLTQRLFALTNMVQSSAGSVPGGIAFGRRSRLWGWSSRSGGVSCHEPLDSAESAATQRCPHCWSSFPERIALGRGSQRSGWPSRSVGVDRVGARCGRCRSLRFADIRRVRWLGLAAAQRRALRFSGEPLPTGVASSVDLGRRKGGSRAGPTRPTVSRRRLTISAICASE